MRNDRIFEGSQGVGGGASGCVFLEMSDNQSFVILWMPIAGIPHKELHIVDIVHHDGQIGS